MTIFVSLLFSAGVLIRMNLMLKYAEFLYRLEYSLYILWSNALALRHPWNRKYVRYWVYNGLRDLWTQDLNSVFCCDGFDYYSRTGCGCYGMTWKEYWDALREYHSV